MSRTPPLPNALDVVYAAAFAVASPLVAISAARAGSGPIPWRARFGHGEDLPADPRPTVLIHGVSVGEVVAAGPLIDRLGAGEGADAARVVLSTTTNTGFARARELHGDRLPVVHFPLDFSRSVHRFLDRVQPDVVALVELEVWPNLVAACHERGIPVVVVNGRLSEKSIGTYRRFRRLFSPSFGRLAGAAVQSEAYAERFREMGLAPERIRVADSLKWEVELPEGLREAGVRLREEMGIDSERPLAVAFSTGPEEEARLLRGRPDGVQLMVVPRKPERFEEVARTADWVRRSEREVGGPDAELFLLDTMGEADAALAIADFALVGRSWNGMGGSNPVPAALLGVPLLCGPDAQNFGEMVEVLAEKGALEVTDDPWTVVREILEDAARRTAMAAAGPAVVSAHAGATARNVELIREALDAGRRARG